MQELKLLQMRGTCVVNVLWFNIQCAGHLCSYLPSPFLIRNQHDIKSEQWLFSRGTLLYHRSCFLLGINWHPSLHLRFLQRHNLLLVETKLRFIMKLVLQYEWCPVMLFRRQPPCSENNTGRWLAHKTSLSGAKLRETQLIEPVQQTI